MKTPVEFLAEKYKYITSLRNRDEISESTADEWREKFLKEAKEMEKEEMREAFDSGLSAWVVRYSFDDYYNKTYGDKKQ